MPTILPAAIETTIEIPLLWSLLGLTLHALAFSLGFPADVLQLMAAAG